MTDERPSADRSTRWLQLNLYVRPPDQDLVLLEVVGPAVAQLRATEDITRWFFVRYVEAGRPGSSTPAGGYHLRVRLLAPRVSAQASEQLLRARAAEFAADGPIRAIVRARYRREVRRYGGRSAIDLAEQVFAADSAIALEILRQTAPPVPRIGLSVLAIEALLGALHFSRTDRRSFYRGTANGASLAFRLNRAAKLALDEIYRRRRDALLPLLEVDRQQSCPFAWIDRFRADLAQIGERLVDLAAVGDVSRPLLTIASSLVHLHCNRAGLTRRQELGLFWCLSRATEEVW